MPDVFLTNYGVVKAGPIFKRRMLDVHKSAQKRGKAKKEALRELSELTTCASLLAAVYWRDGKVLERTP